MIAVILCITLLLIFSLYSANINSSKSIRYLKSARNKTLLYLGDNYTSWIDTNSTLLGEWFPTPLDRCVISMNNSISACKLLHAWNASGHDIHPISLDYTDQLPKSVYKMPIGFGIEYGPNEYNIVNLLIYFKNNNITFISVGDSIGHHLIRAIVFECVRLYGNNIIVTPPLKQLNDKMSYHELHITLTKNLTIRFVHVGFYECIDSVVTVQDVIVNLRKKYMHDHFVVMLNVGLHCHKETEYEIVLRKNFEFVENSQLSITFFYKQTSYQHFPTVSGEYYSDSPLLNISGASNSTLQCVPHDYQVTPMHQRVEDEEIQLANRRYILSNYTIRPIHVLPFRHTAMLWDLHSKNVIVTKNLKYMDCSHFVHYYPLLHQPLFYTLHRHFIT